MFSSSAYFLRQDIIRQKQEEVKDLEEKNRALTQYNQIQQENHKLEIRNQRDKKEIVSYYSEILTLEREKRTLEEQIKRLENELSSPALESPIPTTSHVAPLVAVSFDQETNACMSAIRIIREKYFENTRKIMSVPHDGRDDDEVLKATVKKIFKSIDSTLRISEKGADQNPRLKLDILLRFISSEKSEGNTDFSKKILCTLVPLLSDDYFKKSEQNLHSKQSTMSNVATGLLNLTEFKGQHALLSLDDCGDVELLYDLSESLAKTYFELIDRGDPKYGYLENVLRYMSTEKSAFITLVESMSEMKKSHLGIKKF